MEKNSVKINIAGVDYSLRTDESVEFTMELAKEINSKINEIKTENPFISTSQIAVLIALEYGCNCKKAEKKTEELRADMKNYLEEVELGKYLQTLHHQNDIFPAMFLKF